MRALQEPPRTGGGELSEIQERFGPLLDEKEAASLLATTVRTLRNWREQGSGPDYLEIDGDSGPVVRYPAARLRRYLERHLIRSFSSELASPLEVPLSPTAVPSKRRERVAAELSPETKADHHPLSELRSVKQLAGELSLCGITESSIRWSLFNAETNGLAESGAVVRPPGTRRVLIDRAKYEEWLRSG